MLKNTLSTSLATSLALLTFLINSIPDAIHTLSNAEPIQIPDLTRCHAAVDNSVVGPPTSLSLNCCLPITSPRGEIVDFTLDDYNATRHRRIRYPAHKASRAYIAKYNLAYARMRALPPEDPRSLAGQARIHCAFCNRAYMQGGDAGPNVPLQIHFSWLFLPWHRWYLFFHERILGSLIGDPAFSLVFWNWDDQFYGGNSMPSMFMDKENMSSLFNPNRNPAHLPPAIVRLSPLDNSTDNSVVISQNLNTMYQVVVTANTAELFAGSAYRMGTDSTNATVLRSPLAGSLEASPHNGIHYWTGNPALPLIQDMGTFSTASRDPIFYAHHSNIDRLWDRWRHGMPGGERTDHADPDFLEAEFLFYDEEARMVKVKVKDALDMEKLGYMYKSVRKGDMHWVRYKPEAVTRGSAMDTIDETKVTQVGPAGEKDIRTIKVGPGPLVANVKRPDKPASSQRLPVNEVLVIQGVEVADRTKFVQLVVFVNMPHAVAGTPTSSAEYVGTYNLVPEAPTTSSPAAKRITNVQFEIGDNLKRIGIQDEPSVVISLVAKGVDPEVSIRGMLLHYV